ncbi:MAG: Succinate--CoA ligase [ADP-forming] subunit alpha [Chroococcopsis gigantea SAG 12.99]|jgi:succinyl-CoA synthetase alpha subunit|nr:CoA-binding protein [Chlorogloea purpurea SAG 13.99]MDV2999676.1 Succinate--CoA ligase [ADP-forming] subunit alpha [Chroococcopsis gigantea SAG 12.99]
MKWTPANKVLIQGISDPFGHHYSQRMKAHGTNIVGGVSSGLGGETLGDTPIFNLVEEAVTGVGKIDTTIIFSPPFEVLDAALEAIEAGIKQVIIVTPGVPPLDMVKLVQKAKITGTLVLGSGSQGIIMPGRQWLGIDDIQKYQPGKVGMLNRSDRLGDDVAYHLTAAGFGQSLVVGLGSDGILGSGYEYWLEVLEDDDETEAIVIISHPWGSIELQAAEFIGAAISKPVIFYLAGLSAPLHHNFDSADVIIAGQLSYAVSTINYQDNLVKTLEKHKIRVAKNLIQIPELVKKALKI